ncbi:MAG: hypothetical protein KC729_02835 [Candidatus Eisenbacteria bacterium]|uniref:Fibronectin type-III domain-containing protein n=1 Tax=Eiseniibacteriota bacterium TaxID=2212470 RepID=A0A956LW53_UNCEI|nr:hypothetical protein [Candidatus Eisenbacteria bacterium]
MSTTKTTGRSRRRVGLPGPQGLWLGLVGTGLALLADAGAAHAVRTEFCRTEGYQKFKTCTLEGVSLSENGAVRSGPAVQSLGDIGARSVWRLVDAKGKLVAATGDQGKVFRADGDEMKPLATLYNYELFALAADGDGNVYAAGAPAGTIVRIRPDGSSEDIFTAPEGLIFDLLVDRDGTVYAAAGERGLLYRIPKGGEAKVASESGDLHLRTLAWSNDHKRIWAGTDGRGLLLSMDPTGGDRRIYYDASESEIVDLIPLADGSVLFAANPGPQSGSSDSPGAGAKNGDSSRAPQATIYRLATDGSVRPFWTTSEQTIHCLWREDDGSLLVGTSDAAALYRIDPEGHETVLWRADEDMILDIARVGGDLYAATGNPGVIYRIGPGVQKNATLVSDVLDARDQAMWGKMSWELEGAPKGLTFETRSGYTAVPDGSWSEWSAALTEASGSQVVSPPGRYLQWRARFNADGGGTVLRAVRVAHIEANRPPEIRSVSLSPDEPTYRSDRTSGVTQTLPSGVQVDYAVTPPRGNTLPPGGVPAWVRELRSIVWDADDPDDDDLSYTVEIRQLGDSGFRVLERDRREPAYTLETGELPDGTYELRITASDAPSNAPGAEHRVSRTTPPFRVDNLPPTVEGLKTRRTEGRSLEVAGTAVDGDTPLREIRVSVDGRAFQSVPAEDGLLDSQRESFRVSLPLERDTDGNWVVVEVRDAAGNQGSYRAWLEP